MKIMYKGASVIIMMMFFVQPVFAFTVPVTTASHSRIKASKEIITPTSPLLSTTKSPSSSNLKNLVSDTLQSQNYVEGEVLVKYKKTKINLDTPAGRAKGLSFATSKSLEKKEDLNKDNISVLKIKDGKTVKQKITELKSNANVEYVQPNFQYHPMEIVANDTHRALLWGLDNTGQIVNTTAGTIGADISAPEAWAINQGTSATSSIIVAVIDTGVAYNHPDLLSNMWNGSQCVNENGIFLGGCEYGYDYEDDDVTPLPTSSSHGTHIAGTIAAVKNNNIGVIGVAPNAKIMALKSSLTTSDIVKAINFAKYNGAKVINASWGGPSFDQVLKDSIEAFPGIFVTAAGNEGVNNEITHTYPSDYDLDNIISVAATDQNDALAVFSNYGVTSVDVGAPGVNIYSTIAETVLLNETFEGVVPPAVPAEWVTGGTSNNWGTYPLDAGEFWGKVLYGDLNYPYLNNINTTITSPTYNLNTEGANMDFWTACDTEYNISTWTDYMTLEFSDDGSTFNEVLRWDEPTLDSLNGEDPLDATGASTYYFSELSIPPQYLTASFKFRFRWVTDASDNNYDGCLVDDVKITTFSDGSAELYGYQNGTSMATPHVAGLAALMFGYNPTLTTLEVKNAILSTGDTLVSLSGNTVTEKRINAEQALLSVAPGKAITSFQFVNPSATGVINEGAKTVLLTVPYGTNVTALVPTISVSTGASVSPLSGVANNFTTSSTYTVTAIDGTTQAYVVSVNFTAPSTINTVTSGTYTVSNGASTITGVPYATPQATFLAMLTKGEVNQTWDTSDLSDPVVTGDTLVVTAQDGIMTKTYTLTVALNPAKSITGFTIPNQVGTTAIDEVARTVTIVMPFGTNVTNLTPTVTITGVSVSPNSGTPRNFTNSNTYTVTAADSSSQGYLVTVQVLSATQTAPDASGNVNITTTTPQVVITNPDQPVEITVTEGVENPTLDVNAFITSGEGVLPEIVIYSDVADVEIPSGTTITSADLGWNGIIAAPTVTTVTLPTTSGVTKTLTTAIEVGYSGAKLSFDKAVRILLPGQAGKRAGYVREGISFTEITSTCAGDSQAVGDALASSGDCKRDVAGDLVLWTKHFTVFAAYTQTTDSSSGGGGSSGGSSSDDEDPPSNTSVSINRGAVTTDKRAVTLTLSARDNSTPMTMQISNTSNFSGAVWVPYKTSYSWTLTAGGGTKTVYARFKDSEGNISRAVTDSITLQESLGTSNSASQHAGTGQNIKFLKDLSLGMKGQDVVELQKRLRAEGFFNYPTNTGYFGLVTKTAVQAYQRKYGISPTGYVGPVTREKLNSSMSVEDSEISLIDFVRLLIAIGVISPEKAVLALSTLENL